MELFSALHRSMSNIFKMNTFINRFPYIKRWTNICILWDSYTQTYRRISWINTRGCLWMIRPTFKWNYIDLTTCILLYGVCFEFILLMLKHLTSLKLNPVWKLRLVISHENIAFCFSLRRRVVHYIRALFRRYDVVEDHRSRFYVSGNTCDDMFRWNGQWGEYFT